MRRSRPPRPARWPTPSRARPSSRSTVLRTWPRSKIPCSSTNSSRSSFPVRVLLVREVDDAGLDQEQTADDEHPDRDCHPRPRPCRSSPVSDPRSCSAMELVMDRRTFVSTVALGSVAAVMAAPSSPGAPTATGPLPAAKNVVLVHGAYADGSCWADVIPFLQAQGLTVASVQNPLRTLEEDVEFANRTLALMDGPTVLVGHSYSGIIVTQAGVDPKVTALVYIAARAPDAGENYTELAAQFPTPPASAGLIKA